MLTMLSTDNCGPTTNASMCIRFGHRFNVYTSLKAQNAILVAGNAVPMCNKY